MTSRGTEKMADCTIGVDISKATLDAHRLEDGAWARFDNDRRGFRALLAWIGTAPSRVIFEPTGAYHRAFERALAAAGVPLVKVNPRQARRFAEAARATGQDRSARRGAARPHGCPSRSSRPSAPQRDARRAEGLTRRPGCAGQGPDRGDESGQVAKLAPAPAPGRGPAEADPAADRRARRRDPATGPGRPPVVAALRHPRQHPWGRETHGLCPAHRHARARGARRQGSRRSRRPCPLSRVNPDAGPAAPSFAADGPASGAPSSCRRSSRSASIRTSRPATTG